MRGIGQLRTSVSHFWSDRSGNFAVAFAAISSVLMLSAGFAINVAQLYNTRSNLSQALDAAITSTARDLTTGVIEEKDARASVEAFLAANTDSGFAEHGSIALDKLVVDKTSGTVEGAASARVKVAFPLFGAQDKQRIAVGSAAVYSDKKIEISMMLDLTGSMQPDNKMRDLKAASTKAVNGLLKGQRADNPRVRIALVPFANSVNAGSLAARSVFPEKGPSDRIDPPSVNDPLPVGALARPDNCATERKGKFAFSDAGPETAMINRDYFLTIFADWYRTPKCPAASVVPLTANAKTLTDMIDRFEPNGATGGHIGVQWAWYMLSPSWKSTLDAKQAPAEYTNRKVSKYAILMTDGEFNLSYFDARKLEDVYNERGKGPTRDAAQKLCKEMRDKGIEVFTIGFKLENDKAIETMKGCASPDTAHTQHYFQTSSGAELDAAYQEIVANIERLAVTR